MKEEEFDLTPIEEEVNFDDDENCIIVLEIPEEYKNEIEQYLTEISSIDRTINIDTGKTPISILVSNGYNTGGSSANRSRHGARVKTRKPKDIYNKISIPIPSANDINKPDPFSKHIEGTIPHKYTKEINVVKSIILLYRDEFEYIYFANPQTDREQIINCYKKICSDYRITTDYQPVSGGEDDKLYNQFGKK